MRWRPSVAEERWLAVAARLRGSLPQGALIERTGGWHGAGLLARIALFALGVAAAALLAAVFGHGDGALLLGGLVAAFVAEWLIIGKRLHASGIEEGLCLAACLMVAGWITWQMPHGGYWSDVRILTLIGAAAVAGLRLSNPFVTSCTVVAFLAWVTTTDVSDALDAATTRGFTWIALALAMTVLALVLGDREYRRPSYDRMLDWLVATLPIAGTWVLYVPWVRWTAATYDPGRLWFVFLLASAGVVLLQVGLRRRRHAPLLGCLGCLAGLAAELRFVTAIPLELRLVLGGLVLLAIGVALDRYLRQPRRGITSIALSDHEYPLDLSQMVGATVLGRGAMPEPAPATSEGGGRFGGGGASGTF